MIPTVDAVYFLQHRLVLLAAGQQTHHNRHEPRSRGAEDSGNKKTERAKIDELELAVNVDDEVLVANDDKDSYEEGEEQGIDANPNKTGKKAL